MEDTHFTENWQFLYQRGGGSTCFVPPISAFGTLVKMFPSRLWKKTTHWRPAVAPASVRWDFLRRGRLFRNLDLKTGLYFNNLKGCISIICDGYDNPFLLWYSWCSVYYFFKRWRTGVGWSIISIEHITLGCINVNCVQGTFWLFRFGLGALKILRSDPVLFSCIYIVLKMEIHLNQWRELPYGDTPPRWIKPMLATRWIGLIGNLR